MQSWTSPPLYVYVCQKHPCHHPSRISLPLLSTIHLSRFMYRSVRSAAAAVVYAAPPAVTQTGRWTANEV